MRFSRRQVLAAAIALIGGASAAECTLAVAAEPPAADFSTLSRAVAQRPGDLLAGNELRRWCRQRKLFDECTEFFEGLVKQHPLVPALRYNAALAYVDNLPGHSLLMQAKFSTQSMEHASAVLEREPQNWLALYIRGLNNLYWPAWYRRTDNAIADLTQCTVISESASSQLRGAHMALAYVALGDAYVKQKKFDAAREVWTRGVAAHPVDELRQRLAIEPDVLPDAIDQIRSREVPVDTDLNSFLAVGAVH